MWMPADDELREALDACRPEHDDPCDSRLTQHAGFERLKQALSDDAAVRAAYAHSQQTDRRLREALDDVPVPAGLAARIVARLQEQPLDESVGRDEQPGSRDEQPRDTLRVIVPLRELERARQVRRWVSSVAAAAAAVTVAVALLPRSTVYNLDMVYRDAREFFNTADAGPEHRLVERAAPRGYPLSRALDPGDVGQSTWRWVAGRGLLGRTGVAYDLRQVDGTTARLYVLKLAGSPRDPDLRKVLPLTPPKQPVFTENLVTAAWQENGLVYVLVIRGPQRSYQQFLRSLGSVA